MYLLFCNVTATLLFEAWHFQEIMINCFWCTWKIVPDLLHADVAEDNLLFREISQSCLLQANVKSLYDFRRFVISDFWVIERPLKIVVMSRMDIKLVP